MNPANVPIDLFRKKNSLALRTEKIMPWSWCLRPFRKLSIYFCTEKSYGAFSFFDFHSPANIVVLLDLSLILNITILMLMSGLMVSVLHVLLLSLHIIQVIITHMLVICLGNRRNTRVRIDWNWGRLWRKSVSARRGRRMSLGCVRRIRNAGIDWNRRWPRISIIHTWRWGVSFMWIIGGIGSASEYGQRRRLGGSRVRTRVHRLASKHFRDNRPSTWRSTPLTNHTSIVVRLEIGGFLRAWRSLWTKRGGLTRRKFLIGLQLHGGGWLRGRSDVGIVITWFVANSMQLVHTLGHEYRRVVGVVGPRRSTPFDRRRIGCCCCCDGRLAII